MGRRCVIRAHYINVKPTRNNSNFKTSLNGYSSVVDHCLTCTRFCIQPQYRKEKDRESAFSPPTNDRSPLAVPRITGCTVSFLITN